MFSKIKVLQCLLDKCSEEEYSYSCHFCQTFYPIWCLGLIDCGCHLDRAVGWKMLKGMICAISLFCTSHMRGFPEKVVRGIEWHISWQENRKQEIRYQEISCRKRAFFQENSWFCQEFVYI